MCSFLLLFCLVVRLVALFQCNFATHPGYTYLHSSKAVISIYVRKKGYIYNFFPVSPSPYVSHKTGYQSKNLIPVENLRDSCPSLPRYGALWPCSYKTQTLLCSSGMAHVLSSFLKSVPAASS